MAILKLMLEVTVTDAHGSECKNYSDLVNTALTDVINRRDFKGGVMEPGRVLEFGHDFNAQHVTVDLTVLRIKKAG